MFPLSHDDAPKRNALFVLHGVADDDEGFRACFSVRRNVIGLVEIPLVDVGSRHERVYINCMSALDLEGLQLVLVDFDVLSFGQLISAALVLRFNDLASLFVDQLLTQPVPGLRVYLMKMGLLGQRSSRKKLDRTGDERQAEITVPVGARHGGIDPAS
jgi:hypothetical protein